MPEELDVTIREINRKVETLNRLAGFPDGFKGYCTPGFFRTLSDYGGMKLVRVINYAGGVRAVIQGYLHPDVLYVKLDGFIAGWHEGKTTLDDYQKMADDAKDAEAEKKFLQPINPDRITEIARILKEVKR